MNIKIKWLFNILKKLTLISSVFALTLTGIAQAADQTIPVDLADATATKHEIALLQALSEVCPTILDNQQRAGFYKSYNQELHKLMPTISDPKAAIQYLSTQNEYKVILASMRDWTMEYSRDENLALCNELANQSL